MSAGETFSREVNIAMIKITSLLTVDSGTVDPLCKFIIWWDDYNFYDRLCMAVCNSAYFVDQFNYAVYRPHECQINKVSFRTEEGMDESAGKSYRERMACCFCINTRQMLAETYVYISRAYMSNRIFIYRHDTSDHEKIYLETVMTNLNVVDELNSFDFVED